MPHDSWLMGMMERMLGATVGVSRPLVSDVALAFLGPSERVNASGNRWATIGSGAILLSAWLVVVAEDNRSA
jgi:hypothetical protein